MPEGKLTVKDLLLATLTEEGQSRRALHAQIKKIRASTTMSYMNDVLCVLASEGQAVREKIAKRGSGLNVDRSHEPKVLWRKA